MLKFILSKTKTLAVAALASAALFASSSQLAAAPLKIGYSDWPGWVAWEIGVKKGWFKEAGVDVEFVWMDYVKSMEAYAAGQLDAVTMTNGDALVTGATGKPSVGIIINDFSNGNDMVIAKKGIDSMKALKGQTVGVEVGFVDHLLLLKGLELNGMTEKDVVLKNTPTNNTPQVLASGEVAAICAWQPNSGQALKVAPGSKAIFTSKDAPGLIYDLLYVDPTSLKDKREEWKKVVQVWYKIVDYMSDEKNLDEALVILAGRVGVTPAEYEPLLGGTMILKPEAVLKAWKKGEGLDSVYGSTKVVDAFNVKYEVYKEPAKTESYLDPSLTLEVLGKK
jgi:NitT/TauT family transport system substrate-binding protein